MPTASFDIVSPYNFELSLKFSQRSRFEIVDYTSENRLGRIVEIDDSPVFTEVWCEGTVEKPVGRLSWVSLGKTRIDREQLVALVRSSILADLDLKPFYANEKSGRIAELMTRYRGLKPITTPTAFETAVWAIIGQQINLNFAFILKKRLVEEYGRKFPLNGKEYYIFPNEMDLSRAKISDLKKLQFSTRKAEYILGLAEACRSHQNYIHSLIDHNYDDSIAKLRTIRGIGVWTANYIMMRGMGQSDCLPLGDSGLHRAIKQVYKLKENPDNDKVEKLARSFRPYRSLFTLYLWFSLMDGGPAN